MTFLKYIKSVHVYSIRKTARCGKLKKNFNVYYSRYDLPTVKNIWIYYFIELVIAFLMTFHQFLDHHKNLYNKTYLVQYLFCKNSFKMLLLNSQLRRQYIS